MDQFDRAAVVTIQGGGVYGLNLLGQLQYVVDQLKVTPLALAGTSAGSIVATLYWAGLRPKEIRDKFTDLADGPGVIDSLGPFGERDQRFDFDNFRDLASRMSAYVAAARHQFAGDGISVWNSLLHPFKTAEALRTAKREMAELMLHATRRGCFAGEKLEQQIDGWIRSSQRLAKFARYLPNNRLLQFGDFTELTRQRGLRLPPLFLTATNLTNRSLELFNSIEARYHNVPVARAVRASAGFPVFFRAVEIPQLAEPGWFCDGGVISNFPAWVFSDGLRQKLAMSDIYAGLASRPWLHIGLRLVSDPEPQRRIELTPQEQALDGYTHRGNNPFDAIQCDRDWYNAFQCICKLRSIRCPKPNVSVSPTRSTRITCESPRSGASKCPTGCSIRPCTSRQHRAHFPRWPFK